MLLASCGLKQKEIIISDYCQLYEEPETNHLSQSAIDYWFALETEIIKKEEKRQSLDSEEELFKALITTIGKYEKKAEIKKCLVQ